MKSWVIYLLQGPVTWFMALYLCTIIYAKLGKYYRIYCTFSIFANQNEFSHLLLVVVPSSAGHIRGRCLAQSWQSQVAGIFIPSTAQLIQLHLQHTIGNTEHAHISIRWSMHSLNIIFCHPAFQTSTACWREMYPQWDEAVHDFFWGIKHLCVIPFPHCP